MPNPSAGPPLPLDIQTFLARYVHSLHQLEILLLLYGEPHQTWSAARVALQLYLLEDVVAERLTALVTDGVIAVHESATAPLQYHARVELHALIQELAMIYQTRRVSVVTFIFSQPDPTIQSFANAFRIRKES